MNIANVRAMTKPNISRYRDSLTDVFQWSLWNWTPFFIKHSGGCFWWWIDFHLEVLFISCRVFQMALRGGRRDPPSPQWGDEKFCWGDFITAWLESEKECIWPLQPFSKLKAIFCKYRTLTKIKICMTCVHKEYEVKIKMAQKQRLQPKMNSLLCYKTKIVIYRGESTFGRRGGGAGRNKNLVQGIYWGRFFQVGGRANFWLVGDSLHAPSS